MSQNAIKYLQNNKEKYAKDVLIKALEKAGYSFKDIRESITSVYDESSEKTSFFDFKTIKKYTTKNEKILDFIVGIISPWIVGWIIVEFIDDGLWFLDIFIYIFLLMYFHEKRSYFFKGLLSNLLIAVFLIVVFFILGSFLF